MKRLLLSALILFFFSASLFLTQISCRKESKAETPVVHQQLFLFTKDTRGQSSEIWISRADGTEQKKLTITPPAGELIAPQAKITQDKQGLLFVTMNADEKATGIYFCKLDGTGLKKVADAPTGANTGLTLQDTF
jgi:hypothetical protein